MDDEKPELESHALICAFCKQAQTWFLAKGAELPPCFACGFYELREDVDHDAA